MRLLITLTALASVAAALPGPIPGGKDKGHHGKPKPKPKPPHKPPHKPPPPPHKLPLVNSKQLQKSITKAGLEKHANKLLSFATANGNTRAFGSKGHNATVKYIQDWFGQWPDYYKVETQWFEYLYTEGKTILTVGGQSTTSEYFTYGPAGTASAPFVGVANLGCNATDYPADVEGNIALISRGACDFGLKVAYAGAAGAAGAIVYNNAPGLIGGGTLNLPERSEGPYVPMAGISQEDGLKIKAQLDAGTEVVGKLVVNAVRENRTTANVLATTKLGNQANVVQLGAHSDSVPEGPGINDDGSGVIAELEVAKYLTKYRVNNAVRFSFWTAEEFGLVGSEHYVTTLPQTEVDKIRLYLNYDMIGSPNFALQIYDGDGSSFNLTGPPGSDAIEHHYQDFYKSHGYGYTATAFDGRSDYGPFLDVNIASGGIFTGAEGNKTEEEAKLFGGQAGVAYDVNYHGPGDTVENINWEAQVLNTKAVADSVAFFGISTDTIPARNRTSTIVPREVMKARREATEITGHSSVGRKTRKRV